MITFTNGGTTHKMINFRATPREKDELQQLVTRMSAVGRDRKYACRGGYTVSTSDVIRWGLEALRRELDAVQADKDAAEYNAKRPARKPSPATPKKGSKK